MIKLPDFVVGCLIQVAVEHLLHDDLAFHPGHVRYHITSHESQIFLSAQFIEACEHHVGVCARGISFVFVDPSQDK